MALTKVSYSMIEGAPFNILDFGAIGDGSTDDSAAVQAAIDAVAAVGFGTVVFPASKTYFLDAQINLCDNLTLIGYGSKIVAGRAYATISTPLFKTFTGVSPATPVATTATENITILGLSIDGNDAGVAGTTVPNADMHGSIICCGDWNANGINNLAIKDCNFTNFEGIAVLVYESSNVEVSGNYFENMFANTTLSSGSAITFATVNGGTISNNRICHTSTGLSWHGMVINDRSTNSLNITVSDNVIRDLNGGDGISCEGNAAGPNNLDNSVITGNVIDNCAGDGIGVDKCLSVTISANTIKNAGQSGILISDTETAIITSNNILTCKSAIWTNGNSVRLIISNNRIEDTNYVDANRQGEAIFINNTPSSNMSAEISGNTMKDLDGCGVYCNINCIVSGNFIYNPGRNATAARNFGIWGNGIIANNIVIGASANCLYGIRIDTGKIITKNDVSGTFSGGTYFIGTRAGALNQYISYTSVEYNGLNDKIIVWDTAAPVSLGWYVGDIFYNTAPTAGGNIGWVCTTSGTPGTWKTFGEISA